MTANLRAFTEGFTTEAGSLLTFDHSVESDDKLLLVVAALRANEATNWGFAEVSYAGVQGSLIAETVHVLTNRSLWLKVYVVNNPEQGSNQVRVETDSGAARIGGWALSYSGATGFGSTATGTDNTADQEIALDASSPFGLSLVIGACRVGNVSPAWTFDSPAFATDTLVTGTSTGNNNLGMAIGHAANSSAGIVNLGIETADAPEIGSLAIEVISESGLSVSATMFTQSAPILTGSSMAISATTPTVLVGSIPPTQVIWQGNLFFSTRGRMVNVLVLLTNGDDWVQPNGAGAAETLTAVLKRRKAYLIPQ